MKRTMLRMASAHPIASSPMKLYGCCPINVARAPVDMFTSNHDQVKWCRRWLHGRPSLAPPFDRLGRRGAFSDMIDKIRK